jgi:hypothetical protein
MPGVSANGKFAGITNDQSAGILQPPGTATWTGGLTPAPDSSCEIGGIATVAFPARSRRFEGRLPGLSPVSVSLANQDVRIYRRGEEHAAQTGRRRDERLGGPGSSVISATIYGCEMAAS